MRDVEIIEQALHTAVCPDDGETCCWTDEGDDPTCANVDLSSIARHIVAALEAAK